MGRCRQIDFLPGENIHPLSRRADPLELRQVRVEVEGFDIPEQAQLVEHTVNLRRCRRPVRRRGWPEPEAIIDGYAESSQQCAREAAEPLSGWYGVVTMMPIFGELPLDAALRYRTLGLSDIVMRTNEDQMIGVIEETPNRLDFRRACRLAGAERIEADYDNAIDAVQRAIERRHRAIFTGAFDLNDLMTRQGFGLFRKPLEVRFLDVVQKAGDALVNLGAIRQALEFRVEEPAQFENRWEAILDDGKWRAGLCWAAPGEIEEYFSTAHP
jgi:hypothetical protein